jgi:hypothetical protein
MKIVKINIIRGNVRKVSGGAYNASGITVLPQVGIPHRVEYHADLPDI